VRVSALAGRPARFLLDGLSLVKPAQAALLVLTAAAGYASGLGSPTGAGMLGLVVSMSLAVGGSTALNMAIDRDIDAVMARTERRPLPGGRLRPCAVWWTGAFLSLGGLAMAAFLSWLFAAIVAFGLFVDVVVYSLFLKRRTAFSIILGGVSGGMPALAGRVLATGEIDGIGLLLALGILLWIPTHIMSLTIDKAEEYGRAGIPTFPAAYGQEMTRKIIAVSIVLAICAFLAAGWLAELQPSLLGALAVMGLPLAALALPIAARRASRATFVLYKGASCYMALAMLLFIINAL